MTLNNAACHRYTRAVCGDARWTNSVRDGQPAVNVMHYAMMICCRQLTKPHKSPGRSCSESTFPLLRHQPGSILLYVHRDHKDY